MLILFYLGTPPTSPTEKVPERTTQAEEHTTVGHAKTTNNVQVIVKKETSASPTPTPTTTPKEEATTSAEKTPVVVKVEVEEAGGTEDKDKAKAEGDFVVKKVTEEVEEKEEPAEEPDKIKVTKVANDEADWNEEADLESGKKGKSERPTERVNTEKAVVTMPVKTAETEFKVEKITPAVVKTPVKTAETEFKVEKITPSPKSPTKSEQSIVKVEHVPPKLTVDTKIRRVQRIEEDEDLQEGAVSKSSEGNREIKVTVEKEPAEPSSEKEPSPAKSSQSKIIVEVEKISPSTDETDAEIKEVKGTERATAKPTATGEVPTSKRLVDEVSISVEKITPSKRPTSAKSQSSVVKVVKVTSEDEDLETSEDIVNSKRSYDVPEITRDDEEEAALELELEGGQDKDKIDEKELAKEFDKALKAERNGKEELKTAEPVKTSTPIDGPKTAKLQQVTTEEVKQTTETKGDETDKELDSIAGELEKQNDEAALEKNEAKPVMSDEELELAQLAEDRMNDDDKTETKPTEKPPTATPKDVVIKVEKVPKVTVQVTKENDKRLLSEKETAKEEKKLKDELTSELEQEKEGVSKCCRNLHEKIISLLFNGLGNISSWRQSPLRRN